MRDAISALDFLAGQEAATWKFYGVTGLFDDGYPRANSKIDPTKDVAHPLHGAYLLSRYLLWSRNKSEPAYLAFAERLADAVIKRMADVDGSLRFYYRPGDGVSSHNFTFYSALTQARYLAAFRTLRDDLLYTSRQEEISTQVKRIAASLMVPVESGGVLLRNRLGVFLEEYPSPVPLYVLNGWLTALNILFGYAIEDHDTKALDLCRESGETVATMLARYDMPERLVSRYSLASPVKFHIAAKGGTPFRVTGITINEQDIEGGTAPEGIFRFAPVLSSTDDTHRITVSVESDGPAAMTLRIGVPAFSPIQFSPHQLKSEILARIDTSPGQPASIEIGLPVDLINQWTARPTAFNKKIGTTRRNVYHLTHVRMLTRLNELHPDSRLTFWRDRWRSYVDSWPTSPLYADLVTG